MVESHIISGMSDLAAILFIGGIVAFFVVVAVTSFLVAVKK